MDKNFSVGGGRALSLFAAGKDECGHACGHPERIGVNRAFNSSHAIDNSEPSAYRSSWRVNQELNGFMAHGVEIEKQRGDCFGDHVIDRVGEKDNSLLHQVCLSAHLSSEAFFFQFGHEKSESHNGFLSG